MHFSYIMREEKQIVPSAETESRGISIGRINRLRNKVIFRHARFVVLWIRQSGKAYQAVGWLNLEIRGEVQERDEDLGIIIQGHPAQTCQDRRLYHLCSKSGKCAYALSQCTQQGEAHPIYHVVTCSLFWMIGREWYSYDWASLKKVNNAGG